MNKQIAHCANIPQFERLNYFYGQMLGHQELASEQAFFREKLKLHNRCLHGWGVVCGLEVTPIAPPERCPPSSDKPMAEPVFVEIMCGLALDCEGNELVVRDPIRVDLWCALSASDRDEVLTGGKDTLYVSLCFRECPIDPVRPALPDACAGTRDLRYGRTRDDVAIKVSTKRPLADERCLGCCGSCEECCVELARIDCFHQGKTIEPEHIHLEVRRMLSKYQYSVITGINWLHGWTYTQDDAHRLLRAGLVLHFSRPVRTSTIQSGVADMWVVEGGDGRAAQIYNLQGELCVDHDEEYTHQLVYRQKSKETLQEGDRLIFMVRTGFLLDHCCQPVDGEHIGGRVPYVGEMSEEVAETLAARACNRPALRPRWTSGNGSGGGSFESWFFIRENPGEVEEGSTAAPHVRRTGGHR